MKYEVIEKHTVYLTYQVEADDKYQAEEKASMRSWDEADKEDSEWENTDVQEGWYQ